ncbi:hypothetical protein ScPMuIL_008156 [Solemya velum]
MGKIKKTPLRTDSEAVLRSEHYHWHRKMARAVMARCMLLIHATIAFIVLVAIEENKSLFGIPPCAFIVFIVETYVTLGLRHGKEWAWLCPSFSIYLVNIIPCFWLQRQRLFEYTQDQKRTGYNRTGFNTLDYKTSTNTLDNGTGYTTLDYETGLNTLDNGTGYTTLDNNTVTSFGGVLNAHDYTNYRMSFRELYISLPAIGAVKAEQAVSTVEQSMMIVIIFGRWLLPRGAFSRGDLSQLLLVYLSAFADIIDFSTIVTNSEDVTTRLVGMAFWSLSLCQFCFVSVSKKNKDQGDENQTENEQKRDKGEICGLLIACLMHDGPFLVIRVYILIITGEIDNTIIFFLCKNLLTIVLLVYRLLIACFCIRQHTTHSLMLHDM